MLGDDARRLLDLYPRIYFACHTRHVRDPSTGRLVSAHQASILDHLDEHEPILVGELARHMGVTPSTMSLSAARLEAKGLIRRRRDQDDGRRVGLTLTESGLRLRESKSVLDPERIRTMLARLSRADRRHALDGLGLLAQAATESMQDHRRSKAAATQAEEP